MATKKAPVPGAAKNAAPTPAQKYNNKSGDAMSGGKIGPAPKAPPKGFESDKKADNDKGVKEGSKQDMKRDAKEIPAFLKKKGK